MVRAGIHSRLERLPAICFLDITGYTRLTQERGDDAAADLASTVARVVRRTSCPARWQADQVAGRRRDVLLRRSRPGRAGRPRDGGRAGGRRVAAGPRRPARGAGPVPGGRLLRIDREPQLADRRLARPGEVLVSQAVADASQETGIAFEDIGPVELKGVSGAMHLLRASLAS